MTIYIFSAIFLYIIWGILLFCIQRKILFNKSNKPNKPEEYGLKEVKEVFIETSDNIKLISWFCSPKKKFTVINILSRKFI